MTIYQEFKPTYLYIKQHSVTGLLYFGKTVSNSPEKYEGSGKLWKYHINKHGKEHIVTLWYCLFYDSETIKEFATRCSEQWDIVKSELWANLMIEDGLSGGSTNRGKKRTPEALQKFKISNSGVNHWMYDLKKLEGFAGPNKGKHPSEETLQKLKGPRGQQTTGTCPYCGKCGGLSNMKRFHFDNCKQNPNRKIYDEIVVCPHCSKESAHIINFKPYHFDNCKQNPANIKHDCS